MANPPAPRNPPAPVYAPHVVEAWAVVVAGGTGTRFGSPKQFADLGGRPLVAWCLEAAREVCDGVVLVVPAGGGREDWDADAVVAGGPSRSESVRCGLAAVPPTVEIVVVHDAARPLARPELWRAVIEVVAGGADAAVPAVPLTDTVKEVRLDGHLVTLDRTRLVAVQTPQAFCARALRTAHEGGGQATDDAALIEALGGRVVLVEGVAGNIKVTSPSDLIVAEALSGAAR
ncbi:MAG: 2-C-methyl-D-erythritol 4-phosphate cytidylyltransferase [Acidimicrobiales bacterium]